MQAKRIKTMIKKYIVTIEQPDSERLQQFLGQDFIKNQQHQFKQIGFNAYQQDVRTYFKEAVAGRDRVLTPGEWGCTKSHILCLQDFLASDAQYALIFEDDAIQVTDVNLETLEQEVQQLALQSPFFLSLGGVQMKICRKVKGQMIKQTFLQRPVLNVHPYFYEKMHFTYAYIVDRAMAEVLLNYHQTVQVCDHWVGLMHANVNFYMTYLFDHPDLDTQQNMSYIEQERHATILPMINHQKISRLKYECLKLKLDHYPLDR